MRLSFPLLTIILIVNFLVLPDATTTNLSARQESQRGAFRKAIDRIGRWFRSLVQRRKPRGILDVQRQLNERLGVEEHEDDPNLCRFLAETIKINRVIVLTPPDWDEKDDLEKWKNANKKFFRVELKPWTALKRFRKGFLSSKRTLVIAKSIDILLNAYELGYLVALSNANFKDLKLSELEEKH